MRVLFDTSAIVKRYKAEGGHEAVAWLFENASAIAVAAHCRVEMAAGFGRDVHDGWIGAAQYSQAMAEAAADFGDFEVVAITPEIESLAMAVMAHCRLRALDALHIGTAQVAQVDLFVTADPRQALAAQAVGLKTELIAG